MPFPAVPKYLEQDFSTAAPGHRFYLYFPVWEQSAKGLYIASEGKAHAVKKTCGLQKDHEDTLQALAERQQTIAGDHLWQLPARTVAPLATGLGMEHPLENGFAFLSPYGLPYLSGSSVKGVLRQAARELSEDEPESGWTAELIEALFGPETSSGRDADSHLKRGALIFWDAYPQVKKSLMTEVMTPHQTHYYRDGKPPHDSGQPNPILFLAIPPDTPITFYVDHNPRLLPDALADQWQPLLRTAFEYACEWVGFGAKTAVGYGHLEPDTRALEAREEAEKERKAQQAKDAEIAEQTAGLPDDAAELIKQREHCADWDSNGEFLDVMESWIDSLAANVLSKEAWSRAHDEMHAHYKNIMDNPDAVQVKKKRKKTIEKPLYKDRPKALAHKLLALKPKD